MTSPIKFAYNNDGNCNVSRTSGFSMFYCTEGDAASKNFPTQYSSVISFATDYCGMQFANYGGTGDRRLWFRNLSDENKWTPWCALLHSSNYSSYALPLSGGTISGNLTVTGTITYGSLAQGSDVRKKNIINDTMLLIDDIANAPLFTYTYKDNEQDKRIHSGTSAQYWEGVNSGLFTTIMADGSYGLMSSELSLCAAISIAKQFRDYKEKTDAKIEDL